MRKPHLLGIGGAHIDRRGVMSAGYIYGASVPGIMIEEAGGGVFNALRAAVQFQITATLLSARGADAAGDLVSQELARTGIEDMSSIFLDRTTASYTALLERNGDVIAALADMSIYETALPRQIGRRKTREAIAASDAVLIDANMPEDAIIKLLALCGGKPVFALAISPAKAVRLRPVLHHLSCLFLNQREARAILGITADDSQTESASLINRLVAAGITRCVLTNGMGEVYYADNGHIAAISPPKVANITDVTGAGDALCGATTAALLTQKTMREAVRYGLAAAALTVQSAKASADLSDHTKIEHMFKHMHTTI